MCYTILFVLLVGLGLGGCDSGFSPPRPEAPEEPSVIAILRPYADRQRVLITRVHAVGEGPSYGNALLPLIQTADVRIDGFRFHVRPEDSVDVNARRLRDTYNYFADSLDVELGQTFELTGRLDDGRTFRGRTIVPGSFWGDANELRIFWHESEGAARYRVTVRAGEGNPGDFYLQTITANTSLTVQPDEEFEAGAHYVVVEALDENLTAFLLDEASRAGLEGAYGVFGAMTTIRGPVVLGREADTTAKAGAYRLRMVSREDRW